MRLTKAQKDDLTVELEEKRRETNIPPKGFLVARVLPDESDYYVGKYYLFSGIRDPLLVMGEGRFVNMPMVLFLTKEKGGDIAYEGLLWEEDLDLEMLNDLDDYDQIVVVYEDVRLKTHVKEVTKEEAFKFMLDHVIMEVSQNGERYWGSLHWHSATV